MKSFRMFLLGAFIGICLWNIGLELKGFILPLKHQVGDCFSNGLYIEKIVDIESDKYVMMGNIRGKWLIPDKTSERMLGSIYTKVNCPESMKTSPYRRVE